MPKNEIKNTFVGGRMNKDLDERLITQGEYRDAMNVQVNTSEGSEVGSLQSVKGNRQFANIDHSTRATCIGVVADEKTNKLYWMVEGLGTNFPTNNQTPNEWYEADAIAEFNSNNDIVKPVVVDIYNFTTNMATLLGNGKLRIGTTSSIWDGTVMKKRVYKGMTLKVVLNNNVIDEGVVVEDVDYTTREITLDRVFLNVIGATYHFSHERSLNFSKDHLITGINIIEKQLFWTDNNSEPKRIHIERYRDIGTTSFDQHSFTPTRDFTINTLAYTNEHPLKEDHITVIRQKPLVAPQLLMDNSSAEGITEGYIINETNGSGNTINSIQGFSEGDTSWIDFQSPTPDFQLGNILILTATSGNITKTIRAKIGDPSNPGGGIWYNASTACADGIGPCTAFKVIILSADPTVNLTDIDWYAELEQEPPMFEFKFPRFSTRYKYEDGEYSAFGPFSEVAFLPDRPGGSNFDFIATKGYNIGMTNQIRRLALKDFIPEKDLLPDDVIEIDILYKESNSPNVYSILTVKPNEEAWQTRVTYTGNNTNTIVYPYNFSGVKGYLPIKSEIIHGILPENQLLRPWDNVPRKAKAQEVSGNRLIYGNYLQNYDLLDSGNKLITPKLTLTTSNKPVSEGDEDFSPEQTYPTDSYKYAPSKSVKSLRTYQLGIAYIDKYGRETPVLTDNNDKKVSLYLNKWHADKQVKLKGKADNNPPEWAEYQKFFIKETSSEYYNLALDRWYDAEDNNIWLSFPSSERNKVDIDTYLILKKEHDTDSSILEDARYDILAIENEAPDFIKTVSIPIGTAEDDATTSAASNASTGNTFGPNGGNGFPQENTRFIEINSNNFDSNIIWDTQQVKDNIFVRFKYDNFYTNEYEITNVTDNTGQTPNGVYTLDLASAMGNDADILTNDPSDPWNQKRSSITAEFTQKRIENKPEFDGRFFVKIYGDRIIREKVAKGFSSTEYNVVQSYKVQYINAFMKNEQNVNNTSNAAHSQIDFQYGPWHAWGSPNVRMGSHPGTVDYYHNINYYDPQTQFGSVGDGKHFWKEFADKTSNWFIDENRGFKHVDSSVSPHIMTDGRPAAWNSPHSHSNINPGGSSYNKYPSGVGPSKGIDVSRDRIYLSWSGLKDDPDKMGMNDWANDYVLQLRWINDLTTTGTYWMWEEDPDQTIYVTTNTTSSSYENFSNVIRYDVLSSTILYTLEASHDDGWNKRTRWTIHARAKDTGGPLGSGPHGYLPTNSPNNFPHFDNNNNVITDFPTGASSTGPILSPAPGIRQDGMANGLTDGNNNTIPSLKKWNATISNDNDVSDAPGSVTWQIVKPTQLTTLKHSSRNPAIFETEPKENLDLEIYHEVGQVYPLELNDKTNEMYIPVGSMVLCWRSPDSSFVQSNPSWDPSNGNYGSGPGTIPTPTGSINIGDNPTAISLIPPWVGPIIVSQVDENTVTLVDNSGQNFDSLGGQWPDIHIVEGDYLSFVRPDGSSTTAKVNSVTNGSNIYELETDISNRTVKFPWFNCYSFGNGVESNRIRDDYNQVTIDKGPRVSSIISQPYKEERKLNGLIYSGIYNSTSGINNLNQFIAAEKITKDLNPTYGSIQKLFQKRINLAVFCEDRVIKVLSNKDALYNADGSTNLTASDRVLGDAQPYVGDFGISKNPESFASENYRAYFADRSRGAILRLSRDGLTPISDHGMIDWFRDTLRSNSNIFGSFDVEKREYNITLADKDDNDYTVSFREDVKGWVSFKSFIPENGISLAGRYYTFNKGNIWRHHSLSRPWNNFYNIHTPTHVTTILNTDPKTIKNFQTLNYEGTRPRVDQLIQYVNPRDQIEYTDPNYYNLKPNRNGWFVSKMITDLQDGTIKEFIKKEGKWFNYIKGVEVPISVTSGVGAASRTHDPAEFSWQGIGLGTVGSITQIGGCTDINALNGGCATLLHPAPTAPCVGSSPLNGICRDGTTCNNVGCCGTNNGYDAIDFDDGSCDMSGVVYGCKNDIYAMNYDCETALYTVTPTSPCTDGVTHDDGSCVGLQGCTDSSNLISYSASHTRDCLGNDINAPGYVAASGWNGPQDNNGNPCCATQVYGCLDQNAVNYSSGANVPCDANNMGCVPPGCSGPGISSTNGQCCVASVVGCMDSNATNYNSAANTPTNTNCCHGQTITSHPNGCDCYVAIEGCMDNLSQRPNSNFTAMINTQWPDVYGYGTDAIYDSSCQNSTPYIPINGASLCPYPCANGYYASNYNPLAAVSNGTCTGPYGCTSFSATNYDLHAYIDDGSCTYNCCNSSFVINANNELELTLGPGSTCADGVGDYELTITQPDCQVYNDGTTNWMNQTGNISGSNTFSLIIDQSAIQAAAQAGISGCPTTAIHAGSWTAIVEYTMPLGQTGFTDPTCNSGFMIQTFTSGCTDNTTGMNPDINGDCQPGSGNCSGLGCCGSGNGYLAEQYDPAAMVDDGTCTYPVFGCTDSGTLHPSYGNQTGDINGASCVSCAENYNPSATADDGSCEYRGCRFTQSPGGALVQNYCTYCTHDCAGNLTPSDDSCCTYGSTGCVTPTPGCHPASQPIPYNAAVSGSFNYTGPTGSGTSCDTGSTDCGTCLDGTTCSGSGCCGNGNGFLYDNYAPQCWGQMLLGSTNCASCGNCCNTPIVTGCATSSQPMSFQTPGCSSSTFIGTAIMHSACVNSHDSNECIPVVEGCMDPTAVNYGSYRDNSPFGPFMNNTWFGSQAPKGCTNSTHDYTLITSTTLTNPTIPDSRRGRNGPNTSHPSTCLQPIYGCTDDGNNSSLPGRPSSYPSGVEAINYDPTANINQVSATNTQSPCCYEGGCILPNYNDNKVNSNSTSPGLNTNVNLSTSGCITYYNSGGTSGTVSDCYGGLIDVTGVTVNGTATQGVPGNGVQQGNTAMPVALNGGNDCGTCQAPGSSPPPLEVGVYQNAYGHLDMTDAAGTGPLVGGISLPSRWGGLAGSGGITCCTYIDGCSDPCAKNFHPQGTISGAPTCQYGFNPWSPSFPPPWQSLHPCSTAVPPVS